MLHITPQSAFFILAISNNLIFLGVLPECVQVADRFHLLQNLLQLLKDIFKEELPAKIFIQNGKVLHQEFEKIPQVKKPADEFLASLHYDNTPPLDADRTEIIYDSKKRDPPMNAWLNVIFKMMLDGQSNETIYFIFWHSRNFRLGQDRLKNMFISLSGQPPRSPSPRQNGCLSPL